MCTVGYKKYLKQEQEELGQNTRELSQQKATCKRSLINRIKVPMYWKNNIQWEKVFINKQIQRVTMSDIKKEIGVKVRLETGTVDGLIATVRGYCKN